MFTPVVSFTRSRLTSLSTSLKFKSSQSIRPSSRSLQISSPSRISNKTMSIPSAVLGDRDAQPGILDYWYHGDDGKWEPNPFTQKLGPAKKSPSINPKAIRLISWNIDFMAGFAQERMRAALQHLEELTSSTPPEIAVVVFLQEMVQTDLVQIQESEWIQRRFNITDLDSRHWLSGQYGTTTLIDRRLEIQRVFRVPWESRFGRDGLFVDVALTHQQSPDEEPGVLRLCNTHLESLVADPPLRPKQLVTATRHLMETNIACAILAGDLNAIQLFDRTLHSENDLRDAYLELGGDEDSDDGYTWGYQISQAKRNIFGCSRMDKILLRGALRTDKFERIGMGIRVAEDVREEVEVQVEGAYVTDHYGVMGDFVLTEGWKMQCCDGGGNGK